MTSLPRLSVVFLLNDCLFTFCVYNIFPKYFHAKKSGQKWPKKVAKSGQKWLKVAKSGQKWPKVAKSGQKRSEVARSGQKWPKAARILRRSKESKLSIEKIIEECIKNASSLAGSWISTVHTMFNTIFHFHPDFSVWKRFGMVIFGQLIDKLREKKFWTVSDWVGYTVLVGFEIDPWRRDGTGIRVYLSMPVNKFYGTDMNYVKIVGSFAVLRPMNCTIRWATKNQNTPVYYITFHLPCPCVSVGSKFQDKKFSCLHIVTDRWSLQPTKTTHSARWSTVSEDRTLR